MVGVALAAHMHMEQTQASDDCAKWTWAKVTGMWPWDYPRVPQSDDKTMTVKLNGCHGRRASP